MRIIEERTYINSIILLVTSGYVGQNKYTLDQCHNTSIVTYWNSNKF